MSWDKIWFGELYKIPTRNGIYKDKSNHGKGVKIVNMGEIFAYDFIGKQDMQRIEMTDNEMLVSGLEENDLLFARRSLVESGAGKVSIVSQLIEPVTFESSIIRVRLNSEICYPLFYLYWFRSLAGRAAISAIVTGINVKGIRGSELKNIVVDYPTVETQRKIADILKQYDNLIENNQKQIKLLEEAAQRLYKEWFVDLHFPGYESVAITDGVPDGWEKTKLSQIADIIMGQSPKSEFYNNEKQGLPFHQGVASYGKRFVVDEMYSTSYTRIAEAGSILFSVRAPVGRLNITKNKIVIGRGLSAINHKKGMQNYLFYMLKERFYKDNLLGNGAIFASITKEELFEQKFLVPNEDLIKKYNDLVSKIDVKIQTIDEQNILLTEARDRLLPKLMSGEIEV